MNGLTHFGEDGSSRMVDVSDKKITRRMARAEATVLMRPETLRLIRACDVAKGDVLGVSRLAGIMAAKQTAALIPLCHPIGLDRVELAFEFPDERSVSVQSVVTCEARTGVEMEAMTAVSVAALTIYDMCKSIDREMEITSVRLIEKSGGRSGHFVRDSKTS